MVKEILQELGISNRENNCYLSLLKLGSSKVGPIVKETEIPSSKIYEVLDKLIKRGLVSYIVKGKIKYYQASSPESLLNYIDAKRKKIEELIPELLKKQQVEHKQKVELFEGQKGIFLLFTNLIQSVKPKEKYFVFSINEENKNESTNLFFKNLAVRRKDKKLDVRILKNIKYYKKEKHTKVKIKYTKFNLPQGITIFRNNIILLSWVDSPVAINIESYVFAEQLRNFFLELWKEAKHLN